MTDQINNGDSGASVRAILNAAFALQDEFETRITALETGTVDYGYLGGGDISPIGINVAAVANVGTWKIEGAPTYSYAWYLDGTLDPSVTTNEYIPVAAQLDEELSCIVTVSNVTQGAGSVTLGPYAIVYISEYEAAFPLEVAKLPELSGGDPYAQGRMITVNPAQWTESPETVTRTWLRDGVPIAGATGVDYTPTSADVGATLGVREEATFYDSTTQTAEWLADDIVTDDRVMEWGSLTQAGFGDFYLTDYDGNALTTVTLVGGTLPQNLFDIVSHTNDPNSIGDRYKPTGFYVRNLVDEGMSGASGLTIIVSSDQGNFTFRVHELTNGQSFYPQWPAHTWQLNAELKREIPWRSELLEIKNVDFGSPEDIALSGQTFYGRHGIQGIHEEGFDEYPVQRAWTDYTTIQSHDMPRRPEPGESCLILKAHNGAINWGGTRYRKFKRIHWVSEFVLPITDENDPDYDNREVNGETFMSRYNETGEREYVNSKSGHVVLSSDYGSLWWDECDIDGQWRQHRQTYGDPYYSDQYSYNGFVYSLNGGTPKGPLTISKCSLHDFWRSASLSILITPITITDSDFHHMAMDSLVLQRGTLDINPPEKQPHQIARNRFFEQITTTPPEMDVISFDHTTNIVVVSDPDYALEGGPTMNWAAGSVALPSGVTTNTDMTSTTVSHDPITGQTTLQLNQSILMTDSGTDLKIRIEPSHADYFQMVMNTDEPVDDIWIYGNMIYGYPETEDPADYTWPQGFFFEDISSPQKDNFYRRMVVAGNLLYTAQTLHGISVYNALENVIADNTVVTPDSTVVPYRNGIYQQNPTSYEAQIALRQHWNAVGVRNLMYGNLSDTVSNFAEDQGLSTEEVTVSQGELQNREVGPDQLAATGLLRLTNGRNPNTFEDAAMSFRRTDLSGVADYQHRYFDLPSTNVVSSITLQDELTADTLSMQSHAPILVDGILDSAGNDSRYGALVHMYGGFDTAFRITNDEFALDIEHDWGDDPQIIKNGQYLWIRSRASGNPNVTTVPTLRLSRYSFPWTITSVGVDRGIPVLSEFNVYNRSADDAVFNYATDEDNGLVYWSVDQNETRTIAELKTINQSTAPVRTGVQPDAVKIQQLVAGTQYYAHIAQEDAVGNQTEVLTIPFTTAPDIIFTDEFDVDTLSNYTTAAGTLTWDSELESIEYVGGATSWDGLTPVGGIAIPRAGTWYIEAVVSNEDETGYIDMVLEDNGVISSQLPGSQRSELGYPNLVSTLTCSLTTTGATTIYPRIRFRGSRPGGLMIILNLRVSESVQYFPLVDRSSFGTVFDNPVGNIPYFEDFTNNPLSYPNPEDNFTYDATAAPTWKSYQTELVYTTSESFDSVSTPEVKVMPLEFYRVEMVVQHISDEASTQMSLGRTPLNDDLGQSRQRIGYNDGVQVISEVVQATARRKLAVSATVRAGEFDSIQIALFGIRISHVDANLPALTLADVSTNATEPPAVENPVIIYEDDVSTDQASGFDVSQPAQGSLSYDATEGMYILNSGGAWQRCGSPDITVVSDGSQYYRAWSVIDHRASSASSDLAFSLSNGALTGPTSTIRSGVRVRAQMSAIHNPTSSIIRVTPRNRGGSVGMETGFAHVMLEEFNPFQTRQWPLFMSVFPDTGATGDKWTLDLFRDPNRDESNYNTTYTAAEHRSTINNQAGGQTRAQMKADLLTFLNQAVTDGWLSAISDEGDRILIVEPDDNILLEPRFFYTHKNSW